MKYIYTPPAQPRKKPLKAALDTSRVFVEGPWHSDGYLAVKRPLPESVEECDVYIDGQKPPLRKVISALWSEIQTGEYVTVDPIACFMDEQGEPLAPPGERVVLRGGAGRSGTIYLVTKARLDYILAYFSGASYIVGHRKTWTRTLGIMDGGAAHGGKDRLVGALAPIMYSTQSPTHRKIEQALGVKRRS